MNDTIVLDTNAIISLFDGNRDIANMLGEENIVIVPAIVCGEFEASTQGGTRRDNKANRAPLRTIIRCVEKGWHADSHQRYLDSSIDH